MCIRDSFHVNLKQTVCIRTSNILNGILMPTVTDNAESHQLSDTLVFPMFFPCTVFERYVHELFMDRDTQIRTVHELHTMSDPIFD